ncbi:hypothetical protein FAEPRAM212_01395 [Faecalibacterium prausnitzii M21/2]|uniref:Uncharacterized protein n=1 Tax=Faecalibacterium prausnitzii M21/2 TaxID=411485 RepID=A8SAK0_9FIRM|nr:hypothetical protein FAEPRAM212_01395 [Faecalibacterium prausnitzii M21/2]
MRFAHGFLIFCQKAQVKVLLLYGLHDFPPVSPTQAYKKGGVPLHEHPAPITGVIPG